MHYALRHVAELLGTPIDPSVRAASNAFAAAPPVDRAMRCVLDHALRRSGRPATDVATRVAREALYIRSHGLRLPPLMLAGHLARKGLMRLVPARDAV